MTDQIETQEQDEPTESPLEFEINLDGGLLQVKASGHFGNPTRGHGNHRSEEWTLSEFKALVAAGQRTLEAAGKLQMAAEAAGIVLYEE